MEDRGAWPAASGRPLGVATDGGGVRIAMVGTRLLYTAANLLSARYGGFETAVEEVGARLVDRGHEVVVYCRGDDRSDRHLGMTRVPLPALKRASLETLSHTRPTETPRSRSSGPSFPP